MSTSFEISTENYYAETQSVKPQRKQETPKDLHVLEVVRIIESDLVQYRADEHDRTRALATGSASAAILYIYFASLVNALQAVSACLTQSRNARTIKIPYPYALLVHHRNELEAYKSFTPNIPEDEIKERNEHIDCALGFMNEEFGEEFKIESARQNQTLPVTTFKNLWMLLKPGTMVYKTPHRILSAYVIQSVSGGVSEEHIEQ